MYSRLECSSSSSKGTAACLQRLAVLHWCCQLLDSVWRSKCLMQRVNVCNVPDRPALA
jgi:hypothetical protein